MAYGFYTASLRSLSCFPGVSHQDRALFDKPAKPVWTPERSDGEAPQAPVNPVGRAIFSIFPMTYEAKSYRRSVG